MHQLVNSPIRNSLTGAERTAMRLGASRVAALIGRGLRRATGRRATPVTWAVDTGPVFDNAIGELTFTGRRAALSIQRTTADDGSGGPPAFAEVIERQLTANAGQGRA